jgi:hypothetical protein
MIDWEALGDSEGDAEAMGLPVAPLSLALGEAKGEALWDCVSCAVAETLGEPEEDGDSLALAVEEGDGVAVFDAEEDADTEALPAIVALTNPDGGAPAWAGVGVGVGVGAPGPDPPLGPPPAAAQSSGSAASRSGAAGPSTV